MQTRVLACFLGVALTVGSTLARQAAPPPSAASKNALVRVRTGRSGGMCGGFGYCTQETIVERGWITSSSRDSGDKKNFPDLTQKRRITTADWEGLQRLVDAKLLTGFAGPAGPCRGCIDLPESWTVLEFSDGTKKAVTYAPEDPPKEIAAFLKEIGAIGSRRLGFQWMPK